MVYLITHLDDLCIYHIGSLSWSSQLIPTEGRVQQCIRDGKNARNCAVFPGHINGDNRYFSLVRISTRSMSKSLKSQNSEDTSRLIFVRNWMTQPRQLGVPSQSPLWNNLISLMCLLMQNWSYFCGACWLDWISLIIKRIEWIQNFKHLFLITPPGAHCPVNRADHVCSAL